MNERNLGYFRIPVLDIANRPEEIAEIFSRLKIVPIKAEHRYDLGAFDYLAICESFKEVELGCKAPDYGFVVTRNEDGNIMSVDVKAVI